MAERIFIDILPITPEAPVTVVYDGDPAFDGIDAFVTVYWRTPLDGFVTAGFPAPVWIVGDYDELMLRPNEGVRVWL